ncbi:MAG TPA: mannose-1-phosphate guanylyltransferase [Ignavibacteria bacterium]|nr:mannose-1-phosphate guanylyltransferase [Ignavibacteria bacterium]HMR39820.1 mannose-1-phosphate guanylyltransferase [Ignavibacteria bacterium]
MNNYAVIMAGGVGTRFWPKGSAKLPKQFLKIADDSDTLIQQAYKRLDGLFKDSNIFVVTNINYKNEVRKQIPRIPEDNIICEPIGRNTAPCIGLACLFINQFNQKANVLVLAADHLINDNEEFHRVIKSGLKFVSENGGIVTLGIHPTQPETGYGYIQYDADIVTDVEIEKEGDNRIEKIYKVKTFAEKPNLEVAKVFLESGDFLWNSGMFIFRTDTMIEEIQNYIPELHDSLGRLSHTIFSNDFPKHLEDEFSKLKSISIDYGVMEKSQNVYIIRSHFGWNDVGAWDEVYNIKEKNSEGNVIQGRAVAVDTENCLIINDQRIVATVGVKDLIIIDTDNGLLICKRGESQKVKEVVDYLRRKGLEQYL